MIFLIIAIICFCDDTLTFQNFHHCVSVIYSYCNDIIKFVYYAAVWIFPYCWKSPNFVLLHILCSSAVNVLMKWRPSLPNKILILVSFLFLLCHNFLSWKCFLPAFHCVNFSAFVFCVNAIPAYTVKSSLYERGWKSTEQQTSWPSKIAVQLEEPEQEGQQSKQLQQLRKLGKRHDA